MNLLKPGGVLVPNFQQRLFVGIATFVGMLLLVGWVAVNEPARMEVFTQQYQGRSIENGASTFLNNCASCHGVDGKGTKGTAPALNNPMLFLKDNPITVASTQLSDLQNKQSTLQANLTIYNKAQEDLKTATAQLGTVTKGSAEEKTLQQQIDTLNATIKNNDPAAMQKQIDDLNAQMAEAKTNVDNLTKQGWDPNRKTRLTEVAWAGSLKDYIVSTVTSGRPVSAAYWPRPMPAWGQIVGGPLRPDEVQDVAAYILNFQDGAVKLSPNDVNQQFILPSASGGGPVEGNLSGKDPLTLDVTGGDAKAGEALYNSLPCAGCHLQGTVGPITKGTFTRVQNDRLKDPANAKKTPEQYLAESILNPNAYVVPNYSAGVMPPTFATQLTLQNLKDLVAFLETQK